MPNFLPADCDGHLGQAGGVGHLVIVPGGYGKHPPSEHLGEVQVYEGGKCLAYYAAGGPLVFEHAHAPLQKAWFTSSAVVSLASITFSSTILPVRTGTR